VSDSQKRWKALRPDNPRRVEVAGGGPLEKELDQLPGERWVLSPHAIGGLWFVLAAAVALLWTLWRRRGAERHAALGLVLASAVPAALLFTPPLCTLAVSVAGAPFLVVRLVPVVATCLFVGLSAALADGVKQDARRLLPELLLIAVAVTGTQLRGHAPHLWGDYMASALAPASERLADKREAKQRRALLEQHVPRGSTVLATLRMARLVLMLHDVYVIAADRGHAHIPGLLRRRADVVRITELPLTWKERRRLLRHYGVRYAVVRRNEEYMYAWARRHAKRLGSDGGWSVLRLKTE
jgi:hypothetical protein